MIKTQINKHLNYCRTKVIVFFALSFLSYPVFSLQAHRGWTPALVSIGGGYLDAGKRHSGAVFQIEYKWDKIFQKYVRPQFCIDIFNGQALFFGLGAAAEMYLGERFIFSPNFSPGLYHFDGGRNLGSALLFRSAIECAYEFNNGSRLGFQFWHVSNASIAKRNPGANALMLYFAYPISKS